MEIIEKKKNIIANLEKRVRDLDEQDSKTQNYINQLLKDKDDLEKSKSFLRKHAKIV